MNPSNWPLYASPFILIGGIILEIYERYKTNSKNNSYEPKSHSKRKEMDKDRDRLEYRADSK